jgi:hypothetical protein
MDTSDFLGLKSELDSLLLARIQRFVEEFKLRNGNLFRWW